MRLSSNPSLQMFKSTPVFAPLGKRLCNNDQRIKCACLTMAVLFCGTLGTARDITAIRWHGTMQWVQFLVLSWQISDARL